MIRINPFILTALISVALLSACRDDEGVDPPHYDTGQQVNKDGSGAQVDGPPGQKDGSPPPQDTGGNPPPSGPLMITEFMPNPKTVSDTAGEWLELYNPGNAPVDLAGWTLKDDKSNKHTIKGPLSIGPKKYLVLARNIDPKANGGIVGAHQLSNFTLTNSADQLVLLDKGGKQIDRVAYTSSWSVGDGVSTALRSLSMNNATAGSWCLSGSKWPGSAGDQGSPGAANACSGPPPPKDSGPPPPKDAGPPPQDSAPPPQDYGTLPYLTHYINFNESLCADISSGYKKITLRNNHKKTIKVGEWVKLICSTSKKTFKAQITVIRHTTWGGITSQEYKDDGFTSQAHMMSIMKTYYPSITLSGNATVIRWKGTAPLP